MPVFKTHKYTPKPGTNPLRAAVMKALVESKPDVPSAGVGTVASTGAKAVKGLPKWVKDKKAYGIYKALHKDPDIPPNVKESVLREAAGLGPIKFKKGK